MYKFPYAKIDLDAIADGYDRRQQIITRSITLLRKARAAGMPSPETHEAAQFATRTWRQFVQEWDGPQASDEDTERNGFAEASRWMLAAAERLQSGNFEEIDTLIDASELLRDNLS